MGFLSDINKKKKTGEQAANYVNRKTTTPSTARPINSSGQKAISRGRQSLPQKQLNYTQTPQSNWTSVQYAAFARQTGDNALGEKMARDIYTPGSQFYNPYRAGASTLPSQLLTYLQPYMQEGQKLDRNWYEQNAFLDQYNEYNISGSVKQPSAKKGTPDQWAAYAHNYVGRYLKENEDTNEQYAAYRSDISRYMNDYRLIHGQYPSLDQVMENVDRSKYSKLTAIDDSFTGEKTAQILPYGTYYSSDIIPGLYYAALNGDDLSEDRDYFEDAVMYASSPVSTANSVQKYDWANTDLSQLSQEDQTAYKSRLMKAGNQEELIAFQKACWDA